MLSHRQESLASALDSTMYRCKSVIPSMVFLAVLAGCARTYQQLPVRQLPALETRPQRSCKSCSSCCSSESCVKHQKHILSYCFYPCVPSQLSAESVITGLPPSICRQGGWGTAKQRGNTMQTSTNLLQLIIRRLRVWFTAVQIACAKPALQPSIDLSDPVQSTTSQNTGADMMLNDLQQLRSLTSAVLWLSAEASVWPVRCCPLNPENHYLFTVGGQVSLGSGHWADRCHCPLNVKHSSSGFMLFFSPAAAQRSFKIINYQQMSF